MSAEAFSADNPGLKGNGGFSFEFDVVLTVKSGNEILNHRDVGTASSKIENHHAILLYNHVTYSGLLSVLGTGDRRHVALHASQTRCRLAN